MDFFKDEIFQQAQSLKHQVSAGTLVREIARVFDFGCCCEQEAMYHVCSFFTVFNFAVYLLQKEIRLNGLDNLPLFRPVDIYIILKPHDEREDSRMISHAPVMAKSLPTCIT